MAREISGDGLTIHTVGFRVSGSAKDALTCIAQAGGGRYVDAGNATQLQAFLRTAVDPNATVNTLTHDGFGDLKIGMSVGQVKSVDPAVEAAATGTVVVVWRDCDLTFADGVLVSIEPHRDGSTQDSDIGYDITFTPSVPGELAGPISRIVLCRSRPASSTTTDPRVLTVTPFLPDGRVRLPLEVGDYSDVDASWCSPSGVVQHAGVYRCGSVAASLPACWPSVDYLYCMHGPADDTVVRIWLGTDQLAAAEPDHPAPWQIVLADGSRCAVRLGGAWDKPPDGYYYSYSCDGSFAALLDSESAPTLDTSTSTWTATAQVEWQGPVTTVEVAQVIYAGAAPAPPAAQTGATCPSADELQAALEPGQTISATAVDNIKCLDDWATSGYTEGGFANAGVFQRVNGQWRRVSRETACPLPSPIPVSLYQICQVN